MTAPPIAFVSSAPGKLILAGEHSVVHHTRALATVIDKRTFCHFRFTPAAAEAAVAAEPVQPVQPAAADADIQIQLCINTQQLQKTCTWSYEQLAAFARTNDLSSLPTTLSALLPALDASLKPALSSSSLLSSPQDVTTLVFLLYYFAVLRGGTNPLTRGNLTVSIETQLPMSAGLGSSASFTSSLCSGFVWLALQLAQRGGAAEEVRGEDSFLGEQCDCSTAPTPYRIPRTTPVTVSDADNVPTFQPCQHLKKIMNVWSYEGERILHGNPSGVDNSCAVYGGVIVYRRGEDLQFLTSVPSLRLLVVNTRVPRDTKKLVAGVGEMVNNHPKVMQGVFDAVDSIVGEWLDALKAAGEPEQKKEGEDNGTSNGPSSPPLSLSELESQLGELMRLNQSLLDLMGVGHTVITRVLELAKEYGFDSGKLTGAGGGGCIIVMQPTRKEEDGTARANFAQALETQLGCESLETIVGQAGVWIREAEDLRQMPELQ